MATKTSKPSGPAAFTPEQFAYAVERALIFERQRDELVTALRGMLAPYAGRASRDHTTLQMHVARAALAKAGAL